MVILARALPRQYGLITPRYRTADSTSWTHLEFAQLGVAHPEVSALVLEQWNLPQSIVDAVRNHHNYIATNVSNRVAWPRPLAAMPEREPAHKGIADVIGAAGEIARWLCDASVLPDAAIQGCMNAINAIGLDTAILSAAVSAIEQDVQEMSRLLGVDVVDATSFKTIGEKLAAAAMATAAT